MQLSRAVCASPSESLYKASLLFTHDEFNGRLDPWNLYSLSLARQFGMGSLIGRVNRASRFGVEGNQFELDAYPKIREGTYAYLNIGTSSDSIFPRLRLGAELNQTFDAGWEGALGLRHLLYPTSTVNIWTASIGKYIGSYYFLLRSYVAPDVSDNAISASLQARRYFGNESYLAFTVGGGKSLDYLDSTSGLVALASKKAALDVYHEITELWFGTAGVDYENEEIRRDTFRDHWIMTLGIENRF